MRKSLSLLAVALLLGTSAFAQKDRIKFEQYTLKNGMRVILHQDNSTPIVAVSVLYHVGSKNEDPARTGFAHFLNTYYLKAVKISAEENIWVWLKKMAAP